MLSGDPDSVGRLYNTGSSTVAALLRSPAVSLNSQVTNSGWSTKPGSTETYAHPRHVFTGQRPLPTAGCRTKKMHGSSGLTTP